jgi:hypothetical protein
VGQDRRVRKPDLHTAENVGHVSIRAEKNPLPAENNPLRGCRVWKRLS